MSAKKIYRTARQEAIRKGLIAKLWTLARQYGMEREDMYAAIKGEAERKPKRAVVLYKCNWTLRRSAGSRSFGGQADEMDGETRVSISSLKIWQLNQVLEALFPVQNGNNGKHGNDGNGKEKREESGTGARVVEYEDWRGDKQK